MTGDTPESAAPTWHDFVEEYKTAGRLPLLWQWRTRELVCSANLLHRARYDNQQFTDSAECVDRPWKPSASIWLLYGLALENLLKGLLIANGLDPTVNAKLANTLKTHDLVKLWTRAGLQETPGVTELLRRLQWSVADGKYPIGLRPNQQDPTPMHLALMSVRSVLQLLTEAERALRETGAWTLDQTSFAELCGGPGPG